MAQALRTADAPNTEAVVLIVVIRTWVDIRAIQVQAVRIAANARSRRPIVAAAAPTASRRRIEIARVEEVVRESPEFVSYMTSFIGTSIVWSCTAIIVSWIDATICTSDNDCPEVIGSFSGLVTASWQFPTSWAK